MKQKVMYKWLGDKEFIPGVPARDLTNGDLTPYIKEMAEASKLYKRVSKKTDK